MTFVLGLVADPPRDKYVYQPDDHQRALIEGRQVLEKYNERLRMPQFPLNDE